jgi:hypothetical protein
MGEYRVWAEDDGDRTTEPNIIAVSEQEAALIWVERHWADLDHPASTEVRVDDEAGHQFCLTVEVDHAPQFRIGSHD